MRSNSLFSPTTAPNQEFNSPDFASPPASDQKNKTRKKAASEPLSSRKLSGPIINRNDFNYQNFNLNVEALDQQGLELVGDPLPSNFAPPEKMYALPDYRFLFRNKNDNKFYTLPMGYLFSKQPRPRDLAQKIELAEGAHGFIIKKIVGRTVLRLKNIGATGTNHKCLAGRFSVREPGKVFAGGEMYFSEGKLALKTPKTGNYGSKLKYKKIMQALEELFDPSEIEAYDGNYDYPVAYSVEEALEIQHQMRVTAVAATLFNLVIRVDTKDQVNSFTEALETAVINKVAANRTTAILHDDEKATSLNLNYRR